MAETYRLKEMRKLRSEPVNKVTTGIANLPLGCIVTKLAEVASDPAWWKVSTEKPDGSTIKGFVEHVVLELELSPPAMFPRVQPSEIEAVEGQAETSIAVLFPLRQRPTASYRSGSRQYGADRGGGRFHAGCDLHADAGTEVLAMQDGVVLQDAYRFYKDTMALEIDHGNFIARYGEISAAPSIRKGMRVKRGQVIGYVGTLERQSMLHLELYSGTEEGSLTVRETGPYQRRADLVDPTQYLDNAVMV